MAEVGEGLLGRRPSYSTQRLIQGKWAILIMHHLEDGPLRFSELERRMPKMTHAALSNQLKGLTGEGLVRRTVMDGTRPGARPVAEYSLTEMGVRFGPVLDSIRSLCQEYIDYLGSR